MNAAAHAQGRPHVVLGRSQAYIGVMVDDLASRPFDEPYRMLTSRCEYRLLLRPDTARERLGFIAYENRIIDAQQWRDIEIERDDIARAIRVLESLTFLPKQDHDQRLRAHGLEPVSKPMTAAELLRRQGSTYGQVASVVIASNAELSYLENLNPTRIESDVRYGAFLERESREVHRQAALHDRALPSSVVYAEIAGLRIEASAKLTQHRPRTIGEAGRLAGVTPSDVGALLVHLSRIDLQLDPA